jgi:hypothetical protein
MFKQTAINISAVDAAGVARMFRDNGPALAKAMKDSARNFAFQGPPFLTAPNQATTTRQTKRQFTTSVLKDAFPQRVERDQHRPFRGDFLFRPHVALDVVATAASAAMTLLPPDPPRSSPSVRNRSSCTLA